MAAVRAAAAKVEKREAELEQARAELRQAILAAYEEGIPIARLARESGLSRQWVSHLVRGERD